MPDALLVLNAGSSSLMFSVFLAEDPPEPVLRGQLEGVPTDEELMIARHTQRVLALAP